MKKLNNNENVHIHDYFKADVREKRKMAHITFTNTTKDEYIEKYKKLFCED
jgi:phosphoribosylaminoimidazole carboxylase (NCAIR synthetase)